MPSSHKPTRPQLNRSAPPVSEAQPLRHATVQPYPDTAALRHSEMELLCSPQLEHQVSVSHLRSTTLTSLSVEPHSTSHVLSKPPLPTQLLLNHHAQVLQAATRPTLQSHSAAVPEHGASKESLELLLPETHVSQPTEDREQDTGPTTLLLTLLDKHSSKQPAHHHPDQVQALAQAPAPVQDQAVVQAAVADLAPTVS